MESPNRKAQVGASLRPNGQLLACAYLPASTRTGEAAPGGGGRAGACAVAPHDRQRQHPQIRCAAPNLRPAPSPLLASPAPGCPAPRQTPRALGPAPAQPGPAPLLRPGGWWVGWVQAMGAPPGYRPSAWVHLLHQLPRADFQLRAVPSAFAPAKPEYQQVGMGARVSRGAQGGRGGRTPAGLGEGRSGVVEPRGAPPRPPYPSVPPRPTAPG